MFGIPVGNRLDGWRGPTPTCSVFPLTRRSPSSSKRDLLMDPPSYEEANLNPPVERSTQAISSPPPPTYNSSLAAPPTPPPAYREAVTSPQRSAPVRTAPSAAPVQTTHQQANGIIVHPVTQIGVRQAPRNAQNHQPVVVTQPVPVPIEVSCLRDTPGLIRCPHCQHTVNTKVKFVPGDGAWCLCVMLALMGLFCGFCLIPLMARSMQEAHHSCPRCGNPVHVYKR